jgi:RNA polymerase sigma-70 factor, ECF subfamily
MAADLQTGVVNEMVPLRRYALSLAQNRDDAEDLVQDCIARALERSHLFTPGTNLRAWLMTILHNQFISGKRRGHRVSAQLPTDWPEQVMATPPSQLMGLELRAVSEAFSRLPREQRRVILLVCVHGLKYEEAAERLGVAVGTFRSRLSRARAALSTALEASPVPEEERERALAALEDACRRSRREETVH